MSPRYLTTAQAMQVYGWPSRAAVRMFLRRHSIPFEHLGRQVVILKASLDEAIKRDSQKRRAS